MRKMKINELKHLIRATIIAEATRGAVPGGKYHKRVARGRSFRDIAQKLGVSFPTVYRAIQHIETKTPHSHELQKINRPGSQMDPAFYIASQEEQVDRENEFQQAWEAATSVQDVMKQFGVKSEKLARFIAKVVELRLGIELKPMLQEASQPASSPHKFKPPVGQKPAFVAPVKPDEFEEIKDKVKDFVEAHGGVHSDEGVLNTNNARYYDGTIEGQANIDNKDREVWIGIELIEGRDAQVDIDTLSSKEIQRMYKLANKELVEIIRRAGTGPTAIDEFVKMVMRKGRSVYVKP